MSDSAPLYEKINAKDFNIKRNLSSSLDISDAKPFGTQSAQEQSVTLADAEDETQFTTPVITADEITERAVEADSIEAEDIPQTQSTEADIQTEDVPPTQEEPVPEADEDTTEEPGQTIKPDKLIKADGAVYSYFGELDDHDNRDGCGRTVTELGRTAYEGNYHNDKRSGKGSYFYKDGTLCYSGDWDENVRHGIGVGVSSRDGSIHVGKWKNNKPDGNGVRLDADGDIRFVCKELSDGTTVLMNYMPDDTVVISKYDESGMKTGESTVSLKDLQV